MSHRVDGSTDGEEHHDRVFERAWREHFTRSKVLFHHSNDSGACLPGSFAHSGASGTNRRAAGHRHPQSLAHDVHGVGGPQTRAYPRTVHSNVGHRFQLLEADVTGGDAPHRFEDVFYIAWLTATRAVPLVTAYHNNCGNVQSPRRHQVGGCGLVARGKTYHAVEKRTLYSHLDIVDYQIPTGEEVATLSPGVGDEIARCYRSDLKRQTTRLAHRLLNHSRQLVEVREADRQLGRGVDDGDLRPFHLGIGEPQGPPLAAAHRPPRRTRFEVASQPSSLLHSLGVSSPHSSYTPCSIVSPRTVLTRLECNRRSFVSFQCCGSYT